VQVVSEEQVRQLEPQERQLLWDRYLPALHTEHWLLPVQVAQPASQDTQVSIPERVVE
jgi:hypothetical protein